MKTALLLLFQLGMAVGLLGLKPSPFGLLPEDPKGLFSLFHESIELLSIPFCLLLFSFSRKILFLVSKGLWGFWSAFISWGILGFTPELYSQVPFPGILFLAFYGVLGFSLGLHSGMDCLSQFKNSSPSRDFPSAQGNSPWATPSHRSETLPKVEGV